MTGKKSPLSKKSRRWLSGLCLSLCGAGASGILTLMLFFGRLDSMLGDALYQSQTGPDDRIFVIGVDAYALENIGPWPWNREVMAQVVETLNQDPDNRPAAIGIDVVYSGETDLAGDQALVEAVSAGNVVVAGVAEYGTRVEGEGDRLSLNDFTVVEMALPFPELSRRAATGHINAMYDTDGVLRHHLWEVKLPDGTAIPSMTQQLYRMYCQAHGISADFSPETDSRGFWRIDFSAGPGEYYAYSVQDILSGQYDPELLAGNIVLIGPYDTGLSDDFVTAADHARRMYGVEYLANVTSALLNRVNPLEVSEPIQYLLLLGICLGGGLAIYFSGLALSVVLYLLLAAGTLLGAQTLYQWGWVVHPLWVPAGLTLIFFASLGERYYKASRERRFIVTTFEHYVDPSVLKELLREDRESLGLGGKTRDIAVLFVDIRGFTSLSEKMEPEKVVEVLNRYLTLTSRCIKSNGGTLDKFVGDCTMAIWGAPLACEDPVWQACRAALDMVEQAAPMEEQLRRQFGAGVSFGVGVHFGPAVVGNIGAEDRMDYTAIGDTVNTASRLEANAPAGKIYISRRVADMLGDCASVTSLGTGIKLKGKTEGFEVLELNDLKPKRRECGDSARQP